MSGFGLDIIADAAPAAVFAGISTGGFGSGAAFARAAILALITPPGQALGRETVFFLRCGTKALEHFGRKMAFLRKIIAEMT